jgi:hypothetical protein
MMTSAQRTAVFDGIPYILDDTECTKVLSRQYVKDNDDILPSITITYLTESIRARWKGQEIRSIRNEYTRDFDCKEGLIEKATIGLTVSSMEYNKTMDMASDMIMQLYRDRLELIWGDIRVKFIDVLNAPFIDTYRHEKGRGLVFRAHLDISIEYEVSWDVVAPAIRSFDVDVGVGVPGDVANINLIMYAPGLYGMDVHLANDIKTYNIDALLRHSSPPSTYGSTIKLIAYTGADVDKTYEMGFTLE